MSNEDIILVMMISSLLDSSLFASFLPVWRFGCGCLGLKVLVHYFFTVSLNESMVLWFLSGVQPLFLFALYSLFEKKNAVKLNTFPSGSNLF